MRHTDGLSTAASAYVDLLAMKANTAATVPPSYRPSHAGRVPPKGYDPLLSIEMRIETVKTGAWIS